MDIINKLEWRYATKKFDDTKQLTSEKVELIKNAFNLTATSFGLQTLKLLVISNKELQAKLLPYAYNQQQIVQASHVLVLCIQDQIPVNDVDTHFNNVIETRNTDPKILAPFKTQLKDTIQKMSVSEQQQWSTKQAYIALGNLMTVCAVENIDACPMEGFIPNQFDDVLNLKAQKLKSVLLLPIGYRSEDDMFSTLKKVRKSVNDTVIEFN
ncbi:NAD(P)H-dependent oxidoreductase [Lacinutrix undariae]